MQQYNTFLPRVEFFVWVCLHWLQDSFWSLLQWKDCHHFSAGTCLCEIIWTGYDLKSSSTIAVGFRNFVKMSESCSVKIHSKRWASAASFWSIFALSNSGITAFINKQYRWVCVLARKSRTNSTLLNAGLDWHWFFSCPYFTASSLAFASFVFFSLAFFCCCTCENICDRLSHNDDWWS